MLVHQQSSRMGRRLLLAIFAILFVIVDSLQMEACDDEHKFAAATPVEAFLCNEDQLRIEELYYDYNQAVINPWKRNQAVQTKFLSAEVFPRAPVFPLSAIGRLFFNTAQGNYQTCTGFLIKPGIVATAGHCVHSGKGASDLEWFTNFQFIPGFNTTEPRPFGVWSGMQAWTSTEWILGGGSVPNANDWGLLVLNPNRNGDHVGVQTGHLAATVNSPIGSIVTAVGYPCNFNECRVPHQTVSVSGPALEHTAIIGSDMSAGSSGGPVIINFVIHFLQASDQNLNGGSNTAVGIISYGPGGPNRQYQGITVIGESFINTLALVCLHHPTTC